MKQSVICERSFNPSATPVSRGFTVIELMIVVVIVAIGVALAVPSWKAIIEKRHVVAGAERIASFIGFAQGEAIKRNQEVTVSWYSAGGHTSNWCIGMTLGEDDCDCRETTTTESDFCEIDGVAYRLTQRDFVDMGFEFLHTASNLKESSFSFDPVRGLVTNNEDELLSNSYLFYLHNDLKSGGQRLYELQIRLNITGRIRICADDDRRAMIGGYPEC